MTRWHNYYLDYHAHFCTSSVREWQPLLTGDAVQVIYEKWNQARDALGVKILAYVVMPDHYHIVVWCEQGDKVSRFLRRTLGGISLNLNTGGEFWKERPRVYPVGKSSDLKTKVDYIHRNPLAKKTGHQSRRLGALKLPAARAGKARCSIHLR